VQNHVSHLIEKRAKAERAKALDLESADAELGSIRAGGATGKDLTASVEVVVGRDSEPEVGMRVRMRKAFMCRGSGSISTVCVCVFVCVCVCVYVCVYVCMYVLHMYNIYI
jgi:hypothetical protein